MSSSSSNSSVSSSFLLSNGVSIPSIAFGFAFGHWSGTGYKGMLPELAHSAIKIAFDTGYTHIDGAYCYRTERVLGAALAPLFRDNKIKRDQIFITTKLGHPTATHVYLQENRTWNPRDIPPTNNDIRKKIIHDLDNVLDDIGVGYVDLLLMHWPGAFDEKDEKFAREHRLRVWKVYEELYKKGVARAIGVSNFNKKHIEDLINDGAEIIPHINQIELHPYCQDKLLVNYCKNKKIIVEAYSPLASGCFNLLQDPVLIKISKEKNRSVGQIILRWHLQHGHIILPKSTNTERAKENLQLFDFELSEQQIKEIDALHPEGTSAKRTCPDPNTIV